VPSESDRNLTGVQRVLDIDLDFFVHGVARHRTCVDGRLDPTEYPAWSLDQTLDFLQSRCGLTGQLPGVVVDHHGELFARWRDAIDTGALRAPFHVTHVDAHADLDVGGTGYMHLLTDLLFREPEDRRDPGEHLKDSNYLIFAVGCRWLTALDYIYNRPDDRNGHGPGDINRVVMQGFQHDADQIQLAALTQRQMEDFAFVRHTEPVRLEPPVPFRAIPWAQYSATGSFDLICLARSPEYTPASCDDIFDASRECFIDELTPAP
jgi:hypothetical protein